MSTTKNVGSVPGSTGTGAGSASNSIPTPTTAPEPPKGFENTVEQLLAGFQTVVPAGFTLPSASGGYPQATVVTQLQQVVAAYTAAEAAKQAYSAAVAQERTVVANAHPLVSALKDALIGYFGRGNPALAKFGIASKTPSKPTPLASAVAVQKRAQTRMANGTVSKKAKAKAALLQQAATVLGPQLGNGASASTSAPEVTAAAAPPTSKQA